MNDHKNIQEELSEISPFLAGKQKESPYRVPTGYFEALEREVIDQVYPETAPAASLSPSFLTQLKDLASQLFAPNHRWQLAGITAIIVMAGIFFLNHNTPVLSDNFMADVTDEELNTYIETNFDDFDVDFLVNYMADQSIELDDSFLDLSDQEMDGLLDDILDDMELDGIENLEEFL